MKGVQGATLCDPFGRRFCGFMAGIRLAMLGKQSVRAARSIQKSSAKMFSRNSSRALFFSFFYFLILCGEEFSWPKQIVCSSLLRTIIGRTRPFVNMNGASNQSTKNSSSFPEPESSNEDSNGESPLHRQFGVDPQIF